MSALHFVHFVKKQSEAMSSWVSAAAAVFQWRRLDSLSVKVRFDGIKCLSNQTDQKKKIRTAIGEEMMTCIQSVTRGSHDISTLLTVLLSTRLQPKSNYHGCDVKSSRCRLHHKKSHCELCLREITYKFSGFEPIELFTVWTGHQLFDFLIFY